MISLFLKATAILALLSSVSIGVVFYVLAPSSAPPDPVYRQDHYWGKLKWSLGDPVPNDDKSIKPFTVKVEDSVITDLKERLKKTRLQDSFPDSNFSYGMRSDVLKQFIDYWLNSYDWKKQEKYINSFPHFKTQIEGLNVHFIHVKSKRADGIPILLVHGWPGSFVEFLKMIPKLSSHFDIVVPSIPGYAFSEAASKPGLSPYHVARILKKLMVKLGYEQFMYHGGDWGSIIGKGVARVFPENVIGLHSTMPVGSFALPGLTRIALAQIGLGSLVFADSVEASRWNWVPDIIGILLRESGYFHIQATKPDTVGVGLNNDPAGLAAYILEKFAFWVNRENVYKADGGLTEVFTKDELLTNIMMYWINTCATSSARLYKESMKTMEDERGAVTTPTVALVAKHELLPMTQSLIKDSYFDVLNFTLLDRAGHFLAYEEPQTVAEDIINFLKLLKTRET